MADMKHGVYHLSANKALYEVARSNNFEFVVTDVDNLLKAGVSKEIATEADYLSVSQEVIRMAVNKVSVPHFKQGVLEIKRGNNILKAAGTPTFDGGTLEVVDYIGVGVKSALMAWQALSYDIENETVGRMEDYKKDCYLLEYTPDYQLIRTWVLYGCWISGISEGEYSMEANDEKRLITVDIQYDWAKIKEENAELVLNKTAVSEQ